MALQEKEFVVKNGLDIKNSVVKLNAALGAGNQIPAQNSGGTSLEWKTLTSTGGLTVDLSQAGKIILIPTGALPATTNAIGNLFVGVANPTWTATSSATVTITYAGHGLKDGDQINLVFVMSTGTNATSGTYTVGNATLDTFTVSNSGGVITGTGTTLIGGQLGVNRVLTIGESATGIPSQVPNLLTSLSVKAFDTNITSLINAKNSANVSKFSVDTNGNTIIAGTLNVGNVTSGSINGLTVTASTGTFTLANTKTLTVNATTTINGTDGAIITLPSGTKSLAALSDQFYLGSTAVSLNQGTGTLTLPNSSLTYSTVTIGSTSVALGATSTTFTGLTALSSAAATSLSVSTGTTGALTLDSGTTGDINIGTNANAKVITLGNTTGATSVKISNASAETTSVYASMTGALRVAGGIGVTGNSFFGGTLSAFTSLTLQGTPSIIAGTIGSTVALFNTTTGIVNIAGASSAVNIGASGSVTTLGGMVTHSGLTMSVGTAGSQKVDQKYAFATSAIVVGTTWVDTGISGAAQLMSGVYDFKIQVAATNEYYYGTMPWYSGNGNAALADEYTEFALYKIGDGATGNALYARILRVASSAPKLQLSSSSTLTSQVYNFTFRKLID